MKNIIGRKEALIYSAFALFFTVVTLAGNWNAFELANIIVKPFEWIASAVKTVWSSSAGAAYILYIFFCLLPVVFPAVRIVRTRKMRAADLFWAALCVFMFVAVYLFMNPHNLQIVLTPIMPKEARLQFQSVALIGVASTFYAVLIMCLLSEFYFAQKKDGEKIFIYSKALFSILIVGVLANIFFLRLLQAKILIGKMPDDIEFQKTVGFSKAVNVFAIVLSYLFNLLPAFFTVLLYLQAKAFLGDVQSNVFSVGNIPKLQNIIKTCVIVIFVTLTAMIAENILLLIFSSELLNIYYNAAIPVGMILSACLIVIFSKILIKAIAVSEENKLVI